MAKLISVETGFPKNQVSAIINGYYTVCNKALLEGYKIVMYNIGVLYPKEVKARGEKEVYDMFRDKKVISPPRPAYNRIAFKPSVKLSNELKEKTLGNIF